MSIDARSQGRREERAVRVRITGRVQGVCFRAWAERTATGIGVSGWVRNRRDGTVEALFSGAANQVQAMLERCREGPPAAVVDGVAVLEEGGEAAPGFAILPDK